MPAPLIGGALRESKYIKTPSDVWRLSDVCPSRTSGLSREQKDQNGHRGSRRHTSLGTTFKVKRSKNQRSRSPYRFAHRRVTRQAAAWVGVRTCWPWETAATLLSARRRKTRRRPGRRSGAGAYRGGRPPTACLQLYVRCRRTSAWFGSDLWQRGVDECVHHTRNSGCGWWTSTARESHASIHHQPFGHRVTNLDTLTPIV